MSFHTVLSLLRECIQFERRYIETEESIDTESLGILNQFTDIVGSKAVNKRLEFDMENPYCKSLRYLLELQENTKREITKWYWDGIELSDHKIQGHRYFEILTGAVLSDILNSEEGKKSKWICVPSFRKGTDGGIDCFAYRKKEDIQDFQPTAIVCQSKLYTSNEPALFKSASDSIQMASQLFNSTKIAEKWTSNIDEPIHSDLVDALTVPLSRPIPMLFILQGNTCHEKKNNPMNAVTYSFTTLCRVLGDWISDGKDIDQQIMLYTIELMRTQKIR